MRQFKLLRTFLFRFSHRVTKYKSVHIFYLLLSIAPKNIFLISLTELELSITLKRRRKIKISQLFVVEMVSAVHTLSPAKRNFSTSPEQFGIFLWSFDSYNKVLLESFWYSQAWNLKTGISLFLIQHTVYWSSFTW